MGQIVRFVVLAALAILSLLYVSPLSSVVVAAGAIVISTFGIMESRR